MYINTKTVNAYNHSQVAYPVGVNKDSYSITSYYYENLETGVITVKHEVVKNWSCSNYNPNCKYKEGTRFRETLLTGSYLDCVNKIKSIVDEEGEWIRDERLDYVHQIPQSV